METRRPEGADIVIIFPSAADSQLTVDDVIDPISTTEETRPVKNPDESPK